MIMGKRRAGVVFVDPPYNVAIDGHAMGNGKFHHPNFAMASGEMSEVEFTDFLIASLARLAAWSADGSVHFVAMDWAPHGRTARRRPKGSTTHC